MDTHTVLTPIQFGFLRNKSTKDALICLTEFLYHGLNMKNHNICIFIDYSKAFDTVQHTLLLKKMEKYGLRGNIQDILKSYLSDRKQVVRVKA